MLERKFQNGKFVIDLAFNNWMKDHGGIIVNIIADMWKGFPGMRQVLWVLSGMRLFLLGILLSLIN